MSDECRCQVAIAVASVIMPSSPAQPSKKNGSDVAQVSWTQEEVAKGGPYAAVDVHLSWAKGHKLSSLSDHEKENHADHRVFF